MSKSKLTDLPGNVERIDVSLLKRLEDNKFAVQGTRLLAMNSILDQLKKRYAWANFGFNLERTAGSGYYRNLSFHIEAVNHSGERLIMVDGGNPNWTQTMLANLKETIVVSGTGSELFLRKYGLDVEKLKSADS